MVLKVIIGWGNFRQWQMSIVGEIQGWQTENNTRVLGGGEQSVGGQETAKGKPRG